MLTRAATKAAHRDQAVTGGAAAGGPPSVGRAHRPDAACDWVAGGHGPQHRLAFSLATPFSFFFHLLTLQVLFSKYIKLIQ